MFPLLGIALVLLAVALRAATEENYVVDGQRDALWSPPPLTSESAVEARVEPPLSWASAFLRWLLS